MEERRKCLIRPMYEVSSTGSIRRVCKFKTKPLKIRPSRNGYPCVTLRIGGRTTTLFVHSLVLEAFVCPRPKGLITNHKNGIRHDNRVENLEWTTYKGNADHAVRMGLQRCGADDPRAKLTLAQAKKIYRSKRNPCQLSRQFGVSRATVRRIIDGVSYKAASND